MLTLRCETFLPSVQASLSAVDDRGNAFRVWRELATQAVVESLMVSLRAAVLLVLASLSVHLSRSASAQQLRVEAERTSNGLTLMLINPTAESVRVVHLPPHLASALVRFDVRQPDGRWEPTDGLFDFHFSANRELLVPAGGIHSLRPRVGPLPLFLRAPGRFRIVAEVAQGNERVELTDEWEVQGWSLARVAAAEELHRRSDAAQCHAMARRFDQAIAWNGGVEATTTWYRGLSSDRRRHVSRWLLTRGSFVDLLEDELEGALWSHAEPMVLHARWLRRHFNQRISRAASRRISARMVSRESVSVQTYRALEEMSHAWTPEIFDAIAERLELGRDHGAEERALVELLVYGRSGFDARDPAALLAALDVRCRGVRGELQRVCDRARSRLAPRGCVIRGFHRSTVSSSRHSSRPRQPPAACVTIAEEWRTMLTDN